MATPNLANITTITPLSFFWNATVGPVNYYAPGQGEQLYNAPFIPSTPYGIFQNPGGSNLVYKINTMLITEASSNLGSVSGEWQFTYNAGIGNVASYLVQIHIYNTVNNTQYLLYREHFAGRVAAITKDIPIYLNEGLVICAYVTQVGQPSYYAIPFDVVIAYEAIG